MLRNKVALLVGVSALSWPARAALGADLEIPGSEDPIHIHAFVSQGAFVTTDNNYLAQSERGSFELTEVGINFTKDLTDRLRIGLQLFARDLGPIGNYAPKFDWLYLDYRFTDWFGLRAGRTKTPFGLYNEVNDIDSARVPILLPQSIYSARNRDYLLAQTGLELYGLVPLGAPGSLEYRVYGGTFFFDQVQNQNQTSPFRTGDVRVPYVLGGRLMWETPIEGLRIGGTFQAVQLEYDVTAVATNARFSADIPAKLAVASIEYATQDLLISGEYSRWFIGIRSTDQTQFPDRDVTSERAYLMASYRVAPWLTPGLYYSVFWPDIEDREGRESYQHDIAATLRFDINEFWLLKVEGHFMRGTADLQSSLNGNTPLSELTAQWGTLLAKTTVYF